MNLLITICARGGSKGIPGKNIRTLNGQPLIGYTINCAKFFAKNFNADITLSTDDDEIKKVAASCGLSSDYTRSEFLATDSAGKMDTINDVLQYVEKKNNKQYDFILDLDVTSPLRTQADLMEAFDMLREDENAWNLFSVNPAGRNPYFNMVEQGENGYYGTIKKLPEGIFTRQAAPKVYDMNASFYFYRRSFFANNMKSAITDKSMIFVMPHICFDLDHPIDFEFMSYLLENNKLGFDI